MTLATCIGCLVGFGVIVAVVLAFFAWGISMDPNRPRLRRGGRPPAGPPS